jgi:hypothetical protein
MGVVAFDQEGSIDISGKQFVEQVGHANKHAG